MVLPETSNALDAAHEIALRTPETLSAGPRRLYTALVATALEVMQEKQYSPNTTEVTFFACAESVALSVGCHPSSLYRWLPELAALGLVAATGHFCTVNGATRTDGTVWTVRFRQTEKRLQVPYDYLKKSYRCLRADIDAGRTAFAQLRESNPTVEKATINLKYILRWAVNRPNIDHVKVDSRNSGRVDLESIFSVPVVPKQNRAETIYQAAVAMSSAVQDGGKSTRFFMAVLHNLCRIKDRTGADYFGALHTQVCRVRADLEEGFCRSGFALLYSRLKQTELLNSS